MGDTNSYYAELQPHPIDPERVYLFKIAKQEPFSNWYVRIRREEFTSAKDRYFQQSLKTPSLDIAKRLAGEIYLKIKNVEISGIQFSNRRFNSTFNEFLRDGLTAGQGRRKRIEAIFKRYFVDYFGDIELSAITSAKFNDYLRYRSNYWQKHQERGLLEAERAAGHRTYHISLVPRESTLKSERQVMKQFLYWCLEMNYISQVPPLKTKISGLVGVKSSKSRSKSKALNEKMEAQIERELRAYCLVPLEDSPNWLRTFARMRLYYFTYFARHTLIRPNTELTHVKWSDIEVMKSQKHKGKQLALIRVTNGKGGKERMAVMPYGQVNLIYRWREQSLKFNAVSKGQTFGGHNDYVFPSHTGGSVLCETHLISRLLRTKLKEWGLANTEEGLSVTMYSIARHTGITRRIERSNWDVGRVATSAGTSIQQISAYYYEAFIRQNPDRWAMTFKNGKPVLSERKEAEQKEGLSKWERFLEGHNE